MNKILEKAYSQVDSLGIDHSLVDYLYRYVMDHHLSFSVFQDYVLELMEGKPVQYIVGDVDFYGNIIFVNDNVLIPRFETELLVEKTVHYIRELFHHPVDILDIGTGSGCIAISLDKEIDGNVAASDISLDALLVAKKNNQFHHTKVQFIHSDVWENITTTYHVIVSNPPYIRYDEEVMPVVLENEPHLALYAENRGLAIYEKILKEVSLHLKETYLIAFEIGMEQAMDISEMVNNYLPGACIRIEKDYQNRDRFMFISNLF